MRIFVEKNQAYVRGRRSCKRQLRIFSLCFTNGEHPSEFFVSTVFNVFLFSVTTVILLGEGANRTFRCESAEIYMFQKWIKRICFFVDMHLYTSHPTNYYTEYPIFKIVYHHLSLGQFLLHLNSW